MPEAPVVIVSAAVKPPVTDRGKSFVRGFKYFINDYGVIPLAVGVVIGSSVNDLVKTMVDGIFTPFISLISPQSKLQNFVFVFHGATFKIGVVVNAFLSFVIVAWIVYLAAKLVLRNEDILKKK